MNTRASLFAIAVPLFLIALVSVAAFFHRRSRALAAEDWASLLNRLVAVDRHSISLIAEDLVGAPEHGMGSAHPAQNAAEDFYQESLDPSRIWALIGGLEGIEALEANCAVLIDLASYVQQYYPEALVVAEQLRLNAREIQWHLGRLKGAARQGHLETAFPDYAQRAIATYYVMTRHVLALYETANMPGRAELQRAL